MTSKIWDERFEDINAFEHHLWRSGTTVVKFFLNFRGASRRSDWWRVLKIHRRTGSSRPAIWPNAPDGRRKAAYEDALPATSTAHAPWHVIPADHKWFAQVAMAEILYDTLRRLDLRYPPLTPSQRLDLERARRQLARKGKTRL